jgi:hypothetical protein
MCPSACNPQVADHHLTGQCADHERFHRVGVDINGNEPLERGGPRDDRGRRGVARCGA